jgi:hypothetical protein
VLLKLLVLKELDWLIKKVSLMGPSDGTYHTETNVASQMAFYFLYSALLLTRAYEWGIVMTVLP